MTPFWGKEGRLLHRHSRIGKFRHLRAVVMRKDFVLICATGLDIPDIWDV
jgi:hypothetical protein